MLRLAIDTHIITSHFALPILIKNQGGLVVEMTDGTTEYNNANYRLSLFYDLAKTSVIRMAWAQAQELLPYRCTAVALTPGWMRSEMMLENYEVSEANWRDATVKQPHFVITETPRYVGRAVAALAADPEVDRWNGQSLSSGQLAKIYGFTDLDGSRPDAWRYLREVQVLANQLMRLDTGEITSPTAAVSQRQYSVPCATGWTEIAARASWIGDSKT
jgi:NAD(P)-dependent dehydrogenase (short-subunit alcohol dehydrogenase family)